MASVGESNATIARAPESAHLSDIIHNSAWYSVLVLIGLMAVSIIMSFILLLGSSRKRVSFVPLRLSILLTFVFTNTVFNYAVGQMTSSVYDARYLQQALLPIWGILLLAWLGSYGTTSAFQLVDNETALVIYAQGMVKCGVVFVMVFVKARDLKLNLLWALLVITPFMFPRVSKRAMALAYASKNNLFDGVGKKVEIVAEFMEWEAQTTLGPQDAAVAIDPALDSNPNPATMDGYRYLVGLKNLWKKKYKRSPPCYRRDFDKDTKDHDIVTTQDIWQCQGDLLTSRDLDGRLKDTCLSFALFWMLLRRYTRHTLPEVVQQKEKTWKFVRHGLIQDISADASERTFRVIEQEISFLYDYFFTKNFVTYLYGFRWIIFQLVVMVVYLVIAQLILNDHKTTERVIISNHIRGIRLDVLITRIVIGAMCLLELASVLHYIFITPWSKVGWVCAYVRKQESKVWKDRCQRWLTEKICGLSLGRDTKHWKRKVDRYSLILHHKTFIKNVRRLCKPVPLSADMKKAILSSLSKNGSKLTNGISAVREHKLESEFSWACNLETHTQTILVWHIATTYCGLNYENEHRDEWKNDCLVVAKHLSEYCAYLVAFRPELIPDHTNTVLNIFENVIKEANEMFKGCSNMKKKYEKMRDMPSAFEGINDPILQKGIRLGRSLVERLTDFESLWKMLAEFWAEQLLYLAPSDDVAAHLKQLTCGGQLITHIWVLLNHAGIVTRD